MTVNHNGVNAIRDGKAVWEPPTIDPLRDAARRALDSLDDLIANTTDPGVEALGARHELATALITAPAAVPSAPADRAALLQQIAQAVQGVLPMSSSLACDVVADAVLAVLPETADRAAVLTDEAALIELHCPDHGPQDQDGVWMDCHCPVAEDMRKRAVEARQADTAGEPQ